MRPPVTEHVPLHSKLLCKNIARASGGANNMRPLSWGGTNGKDPNFYSIRAINGSFPFVTPQYDMRPPVTEHVPLHSKSLCKNMAHASGGRK